MGKCDHCDGTGEVLEPSRTPEEPGRMIPCANCAERPAATVCRFVDCQEERLPKTIWCRYHRYPRAREDGICLSTGCHDDAYRPSPWCINHLHRVEQAEELDALREAGRALLDDPRSLDPEGCRKPMLDALALALGATP